MNWKIKEINFKLLYCLAFVWMFAASTLIAQEPDLYAYIVTQDDSNVGSHIDKVNMQNLMESIKQNVPGMKVHVKYIEDIHASKERIQREIRNVNIDDNDVVWFYYSGHGANYDGWPETDETEVPLTWVHSKIKATDARLTIAMYDCCSVSAPVASAPSDINAKSTYYKFLFLEATGNVISASCSSRQLSYGHPQSGGIFTNSFIDAIKSQATWKDVFVNAKSMTTTNAQQRGKEQVPIYDIQVNSRPPIPAPSFKTKRYNSLDSIAIEMTNTCHFNKIYVNVTVADIKRWNPGVNKRNFKSFKKLEFDPNDPELKPSAN